jgi:hypothetical protein
MKPILLLFFVFLILAFNFEEEKSLLNFACQQTDFHIIENTKKTNFINSIEEQKLHSKFTTFLLKAKLTHSNSQSFYKSVYACIQIWQIDFENEEKCSKAIVGLKKCFPNDCGKIVDHNSIPMKINPTIWIFTPTTIYVASIPCAQVDEKWTKFKQNFAAYFGFENSEIIVSKCGSIEFTTKEKLNSEID